MNNRLRSYEKAWFLIGLGVLGLFLFSPRDSWFVFFLIPLVAWFLVYASRHPLFAPVRRKPRTLTKIIFWKKKGHVVLAVPCDKIEE